MKYAVILPALLGYAAAQSAYGSSISSAIVAIYTGVASLDAEVKTFNGAASAATQAQNQASSILNSIKAADAVVTAGPSITDAGVALALTTPLNTLTADLSAVVTDLISKHGAFVSACKGPVVSSQLAAQLSAANKLGSDLVSHLPAYATGIASSYTFTISSYLQSALNAYKTDSTTPAACSTLKAVASPK